MCDFQLMPFVVDKWDGKDKNSVEYMDFYADHFPNCHKKHEGSAGSMETAGVVHIFEDSLDTRGIRYNPLQLNFKPITPNH